MSQFTDSRKISRIATVICLILLCVNLPFTQGHSQMNILLNAVMCLSPAVLLLRRARVFICRIDIPMLTVVLTVGVLPLFLFPETVRWTTMLFTCAYCFFFMMLARLVRIAELTPRIILLIIRTVVFIMAIALVIQQIMVLCGISTFGFGSNYVHPLLKWKLNSLTAEPSHTIVTLSTIMFFYTQTCRVINPRESFLTNIKKKPLLWLAYAWVTCTCGSSSALILGPLCLLPFVDRDNVFKWLAAACTIGALIFLTPIKDTRHVSRIINTFAAATTLDEDKLMEADLSASARIVPTIRGAVLLNPADIRFYSGHGVDADQRDTAPRPCDDEERGFAGVFSLLYNYGLLAALAFWTGIAMVTLIPGRTLSIVPFIFAIQIGADYNMQLVWMIMAFSMVFKFSVCRCNQLLSVCGHHQ